MATGTGTNHTLPEYWVMAPWWVMNVDSNLHNDKVRVAIRYSRVGSQ